MPHKRRKPCAYCGQAGAATVDHVIPRSLYPLSKSSSRIQRITVPTCEVCNGSWTDDEAHFRNMLLISGNSNASVLELWEGKVRRSFGYADGRRRRLDLMAQMKPVQSTDGLQHKVYPGRDARVMRIIRKVIRGLCHHHDVLTAVGDDQVWATLQTFPIPPAFLEEMMHYHVEEDIVQYKYALTEDDSNINSCWLLRFYERTLFFGIVFRSAEAMARTEDNWLSETVG